MLSAPLLVTPFDQLFTAPPRRVLQSSVAWSSPFKLGLKGPLRTDQIGERCRIWQFACSGTSTLTVLPTLMCTNAWLSKRWSP